MKIWLRAKICALTWWLSLDFWVRFDQAKGTKNISRTIIMSPEIEFFAARNLTSIISSSFEATFSIETFEKRKSQSPLKQWSKASSRWKWWFVEWQKLFLSTKRQIRHIFRIVANWIASQNISRRKIIAKSPILIGLSMLPTLRPKRPRFEWKTHSVRCLKSSQKAINNSMFLNFH